MTTTTERRVRPWWGMGDALLMIPLTVAVLAAGLGLLVILAAVEGVPLDDVFGADSNLTGAMLVLPTLLQGVVWTAWPFVVSRWKGLGAAADWGWVFKPVDLGIGLGVAMIGLFSAGIVGLAVSAAVGLDDQTAAENTAILSDLKGSPWLWGMLFLVVILGPISEELVFRGLILRAVAKRWGVVAGVIGSQVAFVPFHFADGGVLDAGQLVLWSSITALGLVLALAAVMTGRLGGAIVAHMIINAVGAAGALGLWGDDTALAVLMGARYWS